jgi:thiaminase
VQYGQYVGALQAQADRALQAAPEHLEAARKVVEDIMELEADFWNMAYQQME